MLKRQFAISYSTQLVSEGFSIIAGIIVARIAGPTILGILAFSMSLTAMFKFISDLGLDTAHIKLISEGKDMANYIGTFAVLKLAASILYVAVFALFFFFKTRVLHYEFSRPEYHVVIWVFVAINFIDSLTYVIRATFIAKMERVKLDVPGMIQNITTKLLRIMVVALGFGAIALAYSTLFGLLLIIPVYIFLFRDYPLGSFDRNICRLYLKYAAPIILITLIANVSGNIDRVMLEYLASGREVGLYTAGFSLSLPVKFLGVSIGGLFFPLFSELLAGKKHERIVHLLERYNRFLILFVLPFVFLIMIYSPTLVPLLFGPRYADAITVLPLIVSGLFIYIYYQPFANIVMGGGHFLKLAFYQGMNLIFFAGTIFIFAKKSLGNMGANGAALAVLVSNIVLIILYYHLSQKIIQRLKLVHDWLPIIGQCVIAVFFYFLYKLALLRNARAIVLLLPILFLAVTYAFLYRSHRIHKKDLKQFLDFFNIRELGRFVRRSLKKR